MDVVGGDESSGAENPVEHFKSPRQSTTVVDGRRPLRMLYLLRPDVPIIFKGHGDMVVIFSVTNARSIISICHLLRFLTYVSKSKIF